MALFGRLFRLVWGADVDAPLRPLLAVSFAGHDVVLGRLRLRRDLGDPGARRQLGAARHRVPVAAVTGLAAGYLGGHYSDHVGRRPMIFLGWSLMAATFFAYAFVGHHVWVGLGLASLAGVGGSIGAGADQAMVADVVPPERHEAAYASVRVANNLGVVLRPADRQRALDRPPLARALPRRDGARAGDDRDRLPLPPAHRRVQAGTAAGARVAAE